MKSRNKEINFTLSENAATPKSYDLFLFRPEESNLEIHFATKTETGNKININIGEILLISADKMKEICSDLIEALIDCEKKYNNGYGLKVHNDGNKAKNE